MIITYNIHKSSLKLFDYTLFEINFFSSIHYLQKNKHYIGKPL